MSTDDSFINNGNNNSVTNTFSISDVNIQAPERTIIDREKPNMSIDTRSTMMDIGRMAISGSDLGRGVSIVTDIYRGASIFMNDSRKENAFMSSVNDFSNSKDMQYLRERIIDSGVQQESQTFFNDFNRSSSYTTDLNTMQELNTDGRLTLIDKDGNIKDMNLTERFGIKTSNTEEYGVFSRHELLRDVRNNNNLLEAYLAKDSDLNNVFSGKSADEISKMIYQYKQGRGPLVELADKVKNVDIEKLANGILVTKQAAESGRLFSSTSFKSASKRKANIRNLSCRPIKDSDLYQGYQMTKPVYNVIKKGIRTANNLYDKAARSTLKNVANEKAALKKAILDAKNVGRSTTNLEMKLARLERNRKTAALENRLRTKAQRASRKTAREIAKGRRKLSLKTFSKKAVTGGAKTASSVAGAARAGATVASSSGGGLGVVVGGGIGFILLLIIIVFIIAVFMFTILGALSSVGGDDKSGELEYMQHLAYNSIEKKESIAKIYSFIDSDWGSDFKSDVGKVAFSAYLTVFTEVPYRNNTYTSEEGWTDEDLSADNRNYRVTEPFYGLGYWDKKTYIAMKNMRNTSGQLTSKYGFYKKINYDNPEENDPGDAFREANAKTLEKLENMEDEEFEALKKRFEDGKATQEDIDLIFNNAKELSPTQTYGYEYCTQLWYLVYDIKNNHKDLYNTFTNITDEQGNIDDEITYALDKDYENFTSDQKERFKMYFHGKEDYYIKYDGYETSNFETIIGMTTNFLTDSNSGLNYESPLRLNFGNYIKDKDGKVVLAKVPVMMWKKQDGIKDKVTVPTDNFQPITFIPPYNGKAGILKPQYSYIFKGLYNSIDRKKEYYDKDGLLVVDKDDVTANIQSLYGFWGVNTSDEDAEKDFDTRLKKIEENFIKNYIKINNIDEKKNTIELTWYKSVDAKGDYVGKSVSKEDIKECLNILYVKDTEKGTENPKIQYYAKIMVKVNDHPT